MGIVLFLLGAQRACFREGPFVTHIGLATPVPTWPHIPHCSPGPWSRVWAEVGPMECPECRLQGQTNTQIPQGSLTKAAFGMASEPKSLHFSQF